MGVALDGDAEGAPETEVGNLEAQVAVVDKQVLGFEVPMHDPVLVTVREALYQLVHEILCDWQQHRFNERRPHICCMG